MKKYSQNKNYKVIAYCISRFHRKEQNESIAYMCKYAEEYGCKVLVFSTLTDLYFDDINDYGEKQIFSLMQMEAFDAVVIMAETFKKVDVGREIADRAIAAGVPVISVDRQMEGCVSIDYNYGETFEKIVRHIVEDHGCRRVNYIGGDRNSKFSKERFNAYRKVLEENNIPFEEKRTGYGNFRDDEALEVLEEFLKEEELPEAIICANDTMAVAVCAKLKSLGIKVPEDIKVTGFDGVEYEKYHDPRLTTAVYDREKTARTIYETALKLISKEKTEPIIWIPYKYQEGHSCGCVHNHVHSAIERLFELQIRQGTLEDFYQEAVNMSSGANKCEDFPALLRLTDRWVEHLHCKEYWLCFKEDIWSKIVKGEPSELEFENNKKAAEQKKLSESGLIAASHVPGQNGNDTRILSKGELVPGLSKVLEKENQIMFVPINLQGLFVGHMAVTFSVEETRFDFLNTFCINCRSIIESYWSRSAQEQLMIRDEMTNLYNEKGYKKKVKKLFAGDAVLPHMTIILLDIDNLKMINDSNGHAEGDNVIKQLGKFMMQAADEDEICARIGGDEFAIITMSEQGRARAQELLDYIERRIMDYNMVSGKPYEIQISKGYYSGENVDWLDYQMLSSQADKEIYLDKQRYKSQPLRYNL